MAFSTLRDAFIGTDTIYPTADGSSKPRIYLDSAASTLPLKQSWDLAQSALAHYGNPHSDIHHGARITTDLVEESRREILNFLQLDAALYTCLFIGQGATSAMNRVARLLAKARPHAKRVLISAMEHHANDLPHREHAGEYAHIPLCETGPTPMGLDLPHLENALEAGDDIRYVAFTASSNVTGQLNDLLAVGTLCANKKIPLVVDAAQFVAHQPWPAVPFDFLALSAHKLYAPGGPGVLIAKRSWLAHASPVEFGGGMIDDVFFEQYLLNDSVEARHEPGTPNVPGIILLASAIRFLKNLGMDQVKAHEQTLLAELYQGLNRIENVKLYGSDIDQPRTGIVSFNLEGIPHSLLAAILNDYFNIAVRNACFCAHPFVREMLKPELWALGIDPDSPTAEAEIRSWSGMVRASIGLYNNSQDIQSLLTAVADIQSNIDQYRPNYRLDSDGHYRHTRFARPAFSLDILGKDILV